MSWKCSFLRTQTNFTPYLPFPQCAIFSFTHDCFRKLGKWAERETPSTMEAVSRVQNTLILLMLSIVLFISINNYTGGGLQAKQENKNKSNNKNQNNNINKNDNNRSLSMMRTLRHLQASQVNVNLESQHLGWNWINSFVFTAFIAPTVGCSSKSKVYFCDLATWVLKTRLIEKKYP